MSEYIWPADGLTDNVMDVLAREHGLHITAGGKELVGEDLDENRVPLAAIDIEFARLNPGLPIENVCSRLDNYLPQNNSQVEFAAMANKLVHFMNPSRLAGFVAVGGAGLGKTHVAVGVAKMSMMTGQNPFYINVPSRVIGRLEDSRVAEAADLVIIDDLNSAYGGAFSAADTRKLLGIMHNRGAGKLMITSNAPTFEAFLNDIFLPLNPIERVRIQDRVSAGLAGLTIVGESFRSQSAVGQTPWWAE